MVNIALDMQTDPKKRYRYIYIYIHYKIIICCLVDILTTMAIVLFMQVIRVSICAVISFIVHHNLKLTQTQTRFNLVPTSEYQ